MEPVAVVGGVDTHAATHHAAVVDVTGKLLDTRSFIATQAGYRPLLDWASSFGPLLRVGVEGTGTYGAGLTRHLSQAHIDVVEVPRPDRQLRRAHGKSDPIDAVAAARRALACDGTVVPKKQDGPVEAIRALRTARLGAIKAKTAATNTLRSMIITAPEPLRAQLPATGLPNKLIKACARLRPDPERLNERDCPGLG